MASISGEPDVVSAKAIANTGARALHLLHVVSEACLDGPRLSPVGSSCDNIAPRRCSYGGTVACCVARGRAWAANRCQPRACIWILLRPGPTTILGGPDIITHGVTCGGTRAVDYRRRCINGCISSVLVSYGPGAGIRC